LLEQTWQSADVAFAYLGDISSLWFPSKAFASMGLKDLKGSARKNADICHSFLLLSHQTQ
jgi:hypothetical protein